MENRNLDRDKLDFVNGKIGPLFRALFFPTLIGMIFLSALTLLTEFLSVRVSVQKVWLP